MNAETTSASARVIGIAPQLLVSDLELATAYYRDKLGFSLDFRYEDFYASVSRDGFAIHLKCPPKVVGAVETRRDDENLDAYIAVKGVRALYRELESRGARITRPLEDQPWSCTDFLVEDPDGSVLCFSELNG